VILTLAERIREVETAFAKHQTDKLTHGYAPVYATVKWGILDILELGVYRGASVRAWLDLFPAARIVGVDQSEPLDPTTSERYRLVVRDYRYAIEDIHPGGFDLIVEDMYHYVDSQVEAARLYYPRLRPGGMYVIEDVHVSNISALEAGLVAAGLPLGEIIWTGPWATPPLRPDDRLLVMTR